VVDWGRSDGVVASDEDTIYLHNAMDAAITNYPDQRFTLRNGIIGD
jgi:hypothetical protein